MACPSQKRRVSQQRHRGAVQERYRRTHRYERVHVACAVLEGSPRAGVELFGGPDLDWRRKGQEQVVHPEGEPFAKPWHRHEGHDDTSHGEAGDELGPQHHDVPRGRRVVLLVRHACRNRVTGVLDSVAHVRDARDARHVLDGCPLGGEIDAGRDDTLDLAEGSLDVRDTRGTCHAADAQGYLLRGYPLACVLDRVGQLLQRRRLRAHPDGRLFGGEVDDDILDTWRLTQRMRHMGDARGAFHARDGDGHLLRRFRDHWLPSSYQPTSTAREARQAPGLHGHPSHPR